MDTITRADGNAAGYRDACAGLKRRLRAGEPAHVEDVLAGHPGLAGDVNAVIELILVEMSSRSEMGEKQSAEEWERRIAALIPDPERRLSVQSLLVSEMATLSEASTAAEPDRPRQPPMTRIGKYQILEEIGRGGMGIVYKARQTNLNRIVALKMILAGEHAGRHEQARLRQEAEATATLDHPNIVRIFDIGEHDGMPYLEMEYVGGGNLTRMLRSMPQPIRWAARLAETLARAIHVAHQRGIVHRDLNPSNILMTGDGVPKISDFGLAKFLLSDAGLSQNGTLLGTPPYMAPEQVSRGKDVGPAADVYAIGVILYEMLTGAPPFRGLTPMETLCQVLEGEVVPPSRLRHGLPEDLETICLKCLARAPGHRYPDAEDLADDLRRFQNREAIQAQRTPRLRRAAQWARREPLAAGFLGLSFLLLLSLLVLATGYSIRTTNDRNEIQKRWYDLYSQKWMWDGLKKRAERDALEAERQRYDAQLNRAFELAQRDETEIAIEVFDRLEQNLPGRTGFEYDFVKSMIDRSEFLLSGRPKRHDAVNCAAASADGRTVVAGDRVGNVILWDVSSRTPIPFTIEGGHKQIREVAVASDAQGKAVAAASVSLDKGGNSTVSIWDVSDPSIWEELKPLSPQTFSLGIEEPGELVFSRDGKLLAFRCRTDLRPDWETRFYSRRGREWVEGPDPPRPGVASLSLSSSTNMLAMGLAGGTVVVRDLDSGGETAYPSPSSSRPVALGFSGDGKRLAAGCEDRSVVVWNLATGRREATLMAPDGPPKFLGFGGEGTSLVVSEGDKTLAVHSLQAPHSRRVLPTRGLVVVAISRAGDRLAVGGEEEPITVWNLDAPSDDPRLLSRLQGVKRLSFSDDGRFLFSTFHDPSIRVLRLTKAPHPRHRLAGHAKEAWAVAFARGGDVVASGADDGMIKLWDVVAGAELAAVPAHDQTVTGLAFSPNKDELASVSLDGSAKVWTFRRDRPDAPAATLELKRVLRGSKQSQLRCVAYSSDGATLAASGLDPTVHIWDASRLEPLRQFKTEHEMMITALAFSPTDQKQLATASCDGTIMFWNVENGDRTAFCETNGAAMSLAFSPAGDRLATSGQPRVIEMWDTNTRSPLDVIIGHPEPVRSLAFSPDGQTVATGCDDGRVRLCDPGTKQVVIILDEHHGRINSVAFSPDGSTLASCSHSGEVFLWHSQPPGVASEPTTDDGAPRAGPAHTNMLMRQ